MTRQEMTVTILGSGTSTGVPVVGCSCPVCRSRDSRNSRTRCSILISWREKNILVDTSPDLRQQALREGITHIDAVLYTHTHADHTHGIDDLRPFNHHDQEPIPLFGSRETLDILRRTFRYIFDEESEPGYRPHLALLEITAPFTLFDLPVDPLRLLHGSGLSLGFRFGPFAYLTDCHAIPEETAGKLRGLDILIIDGLRFTPHSTHFNIPQAISAAVRLGARRTFLTHLSHEVDHSRHSRDLPPGVEFAFDGLRLPIVWNG
jgi:phosphoribosyl 1,2-cyclic phosphate phosphodiesterase